MDWGLVILKSVLLSNNSDVKHVGVVHAVINMPNRVLHAPKPEASRTELVIVIAGKSLPKLLQ
jgi:hypothetical protein